MRCSLAISVSVLLVALLECLCVYSKQHSLEEHLFAKLGNIKNYVVYYGGDKIDELSKFDLVILDPGELPRTKVRSFPRSIRLFSETSYGS